MDGGISQRFKTLLCGTTRGAVDFVSRHKRSRGIAETQMSSFGVLGLEGVVMGGGRGLGHGHGHGRGRGRVGGGLGKAHGQFAHQKSRYPVSDHPFKGVPWVSMF